MADIIKNKGKLVVPLGQDLNEAFKKKVQYDLHIENPLELGMEAYYHPKDYDTYPSNLETGFVQQAIMATDQFEFLDGPNGDKNQYIGFLSLAFPLVSYKNRDFREQQFVLKFPVRTINKMFAQRVYKLPQEYHPHLLEIHFKKKTKYRYSLLYLAIVQWSGSGKRFQRIKVEYHNKNHNPNKAIEKLKESKEGKK